MFFRNTNIDYSQDGLETLFRDNLFRVYQEQQFNLDWDYQLMWGLENDVEELLWPVQQVGG